MSTNFEDFYSDSEGFAKNLGHGMVTVDHLSAVVLTLPSVVAFFEDSKFDFSAEQVHSDLVNELTQMVAPRLPKSMEDEMAQTDMMPISPMMQQIVSDLAKEAVIQQLIESDYTVPGFFILFECLSWPNTVLEAVLNSRGVSRSELALALQSHVDRNNEKPVDLRAGTKDEAIKGDTQMSGPRTQQEKKKGLEAFTTNLTELAKQGKLDPLIGRSVELSDLVQIVSRKTKKNAALVGDPGVGKTQIIDGLAQRIADDQVPEELKGVQILSLNMGAFTAGTKYRGEFEERVDNLLKELKGKDNVILFIDEIHTIMGAGAAASGAMDMSNLLKPALSRGEIRVIGATTYDEYRKHIEKDAALARRFMKIDIVEPSFEETREIVNGVVGTFETFHKVKFTPEAVEAVLELSKKFLLNKRFPDKAIDLLDASGARNRTKEVPAKEIVRADIESEVARIANLPLEIVACEESERVMNLESNLKARVFGQDKAIEKLVENVMVARAGLRSKASIQGAFMFVGPSGTGKTEITKALADSMGVELVRFDMSEFSQEHNVAKLIGSPPGYVGHDSGNGQLLDKVEQYPNCILLLDEIEKANPKVLLTFLQVMDEGRLTGSQGKTVYFNNVTVVMTTNLGAAQSSKVGIGFSSGGDDGMDSAVKAHLPPEFLNRIDAIVKFNELGDTAIRSVVDKFLGELNDSVVGRGVKVVLSDDVYAWLAKNGVQKGMGARPMKRLMDSNLRVPLAKELLCGSLMKGGIATFELQDGKVVLV